MISWKEVTPDRREWTISEYLRGFALPDAIAIGWAVSNGAALIVHQSVYTSVRGHVSKHSNEVGGLLIGRVSRGKLNMLGQASLLVSVEQSVPSHAFTGTGVSLRMEPELWSSAEAYLSERRAIVGWYHSHPNLGAFFSGTDRRTQANFFHHDYSFGWVVDPIRNDEKWFRGAESESFPEAQILRFAEH